MMENIGMEGISPELAAAILASYGASATPEKSGGQSYTYGDDSEYSSLLAQLSGGTQPGFAQGGNVSMSPLLLMASGGHDVPHKGSHYVQGAGGGQDDLIDAKLADGEYVFDADIVAALGDGSNKEGAKRLDAMREQIRKHKRSASNNKIPPMAKSPLAYLRDAMKEKK